MAFPSRGVIFRPSKVVPRLKLCRSIYHTLSRVTSGGGTAYLLSLAEIIACKDASLVEVFSCSWTPSLTCDKLLQIKRGTQWSAPTSDATSWFAFLAW